MNNFHVSVLLQEAIQYLNVKPGGKYIDATLGGGGHALQIVKLGGTVLGIDLDEDALKYVKRNITELDESLKSHLILVRGNFKDLKRIADQHAFTPIDGIIFDLGVSSYQLDEAIKGFSLTSNGPLDMRMDQSLKVTAADLINGLTKGELQELFTKLGEEAYAHVIANAIIQSRKLKKIETTLELAQLVAKVYPRKNSKIHPATKVFQALRIAVNDELNNIKTALPDTVHIMANNGRVCIISFHSLEDRIVKQSFLQFQEQHLGNILTKKPVTPGDEEIARNIRGRSAKMRVFERLYE